MEIENYWDITGYTKESTTDFRYNEFAKYVSIDAQVLDVGCGYGRILNVLQSKGYKNLIGIDSSYKMIERGQSEFRSIDLRVTNGKELPFESSSMDAVVLCGVLTCIVQNQEQLFFISEVTRVLKENGILYINDFLLNNDVRHILRYNTFKQKYNCFGVFELTERVALRHHSREWLEVLLNCFEKLEYEEVIYKTMNGHKSNGFYFIGGKKQCAVAMPLPDEQDETSD